MSLLCSSGLSLNKRIDIQTQKKLFDCQPQVFDTPSVPLIFYVIKSIIYISLILKNYFKITEFPQKQSF